MFCVMSVSRGDQRHLHSRGCVPQRLVPRGESETAADSEIKIDLSIRGQSMRASQPEGCTANTPRFGVRLNGQTTRQFEQRRAALQEDAMTPFGLHLRHLIGFFKIGGSLVGGAIARAAQVGAGQWVLDDSQEDIGPYVPTRIAVPKTFAACGEDFSGAEECIDRSYVGGAAGDVAGRVLDLRPARDR
jgi:hypothetical protein